MVTRFLIVDDSRALAENLAEIAEEHEGIEAFAFDDPSAALAWAQSHDFDAALVDLRMRPFDGVELRKRLDALGRSAAYFLMTSYPDDARAVEAWHGGFVDVWEKPPPRDWPLRLRPEVSGVHALGPAKVRPEAEPQRRFAKTPT